MLQTSFRKILLIASTIVSTNIYAETVAVAVASNFTATIKTIATKFQQQTEHTLALSFGSTGKLYTQIIHNAPFDIFLAADQKHPQLLQQQNLARDHKIYAIGKLVLWRKQQSSEPLLQQLQQGQYNHIAIANPKTAPYGIAALEVLQYLNLRQKTAKKLVYGDNIAQTYQFVATRNAEIGFVAQSQIALDTSGQWWQIPQTMYQPLRQGAILLQRSEQNPAAKEFWDFLNSDTVNGILHQFGYDTIATNGS